ncbi:hypothetical protein NQZ68_018780, partial [Dissostichus eleginoides]
IRNSAPQHAVNRPAMIPDGSGNAADGKSSHFKPQKSDDGKGTESNPLLIRSPDKTGCIVWIDGSMKKLTGALRGFDPYSPNPADSTEAADMRDFLVGLEDEVCCIAVTRFRRDAPGEGSA